MMECIECKDLFKQYKDKAALKNINLSLEKGKIYGLIGRNGAGKTTLLSIMSAQNPATKGTVTVDGEPIWENPNALKKICFSRELNIFIKVVLWQFCHRFLGTPLVCPFLFYR